MDDADSPVHEEPASEIAFEDIDEEPPHVQIVEDPAEEQLKYCQVIIHIVIL